MWPGEGSIQVRKFSRKVDYTKEEIRDVMNLLEAAPPSRDDHREQLTVLVASYKSKEMIGNDLTQDQVKRLSEKDVENVSPDTRLHCQQKLVMQWLKHFSNFHAKHWGVFSLWIKKIF